MDAESDDSERWEDFFGSTTDLSSSLMGLCDSLTSNLDSNLSDENDTEKDNSIYVPDNNDSVNKKKNNSVNKEKNISVNTEKNISVNTEKNNSVNTEKNDSVNTENTETNNSISSANNNNNNDIELHSNITKISDENKSVTDDTSKIKSSVLINNNSTKRCLSANNNSNRLLRKITNKYTFSNIPLSRNISKLAKFGEEQSEEQSEESSVEKETTPPPITTSSISEKCSLASSPILTYARAKSLATNNKLSNLSRKLSSESLDQLTTLPKTDKKSDISKLKHRPLSSTSICSMSSSSSSGSESLLNGKLGVSYLESNESLTDQNENENSQENNLTVFERSCMEIIDSERNYVEDLRQVITGYLEDWKQRSSLKVDELKVLFSNIQEIYDFNLLLLEKLTNSGLDPIKISKSFIELKDEFNVYATYCTSYPGAISLLTSLLQQSHTNALLTSTQKTLQHTLPLGSYLLKPVQRILKYHLLLNNLRKHCDSEEVVQAYDMMRQVARNIDQVKTKLEQQNRVKELSNMLDGWLGPELTVLGELIQEGLLMENNKPRLVFLFQMMLLITKPKEDNRLQFKSVIYRNKLMLREHLPGEPTSFNIVPYDDPRSQIKLTAKNRDQKRLWAQNIKGVILEQFDIPNRAKELVYKFGDDEDRKPDKNMWRKNSNSSKPIYLDRRNQLRRSEMRNLSKNKVKILIRSSSIEELTGNKIDDNNSSPKSIKGNQLIKRQSADDTVISLSTHHLDHNDCEQHQNNTCNRNSTENEQQNNEGKINSNVSDNSIKELNESVPKILSSTDNTSGDSDNNDDSDDGSRKKPPKSDEVKTYTKKSIQKKFENLKKSQQKKETWKLDIDFNEFQNTVLKITESSENLKITEKSDEEKKNEENSISIVSKCKEESGQKKTAEINKNDCNIKKKGEYFQTQEKFKKDAEIVCELLKTRGFNKVLKKIPKKRSLDNSRLLSSQELYNYELNSTPPPLPSNSPPPLNTETDEEIISYLPKKDIQNPEPIYESLLRNVHVPYKFALMLNKSKSQQYYTNTFKELQYSKSATKSEPDYVTLVYRENGNLHSVNNSVVETVKPTKVFRNSDSDINYDNATENKNIISNRLSTISENEIQKQILNLKPTKNLIQKPTISPKVENVSTSENSLLPRAKKIDDNTNIGFGKINKPTERKVSDTTEMYHQSIIHRQGCEALGERMANLDYVDPKSLFGNFLNCSTMSVNPQHDSASSLTSSNDSVCDSKRNKQSQHTETTSFIYEDNVEACLEKNFRDSAVYSDDNERRFDNFENHCKETTKIQYSKISPSLPPFSKRIYIGNPTKNVNNVSKLITPRNMGPSLPIPVKPNLSNLKNSNMNIKNKAENNHNFDKNKNFNIHNNHLKLPSKTVESNLSRTTTRTTTTPKTNSKSWVVLQIENFNKSSNTNSG